MPFPFSCSIHTYKTSFSNHTTKKQSFQINFLQVKPYKKVFGVNSTSDIQQNTSEPGSHLERKTEQSADNIKAW